MRQDGKICLSCNSEKEAENNIISLYNALHEEELPEGTKIEKIKVGDAIYMNLKNDISFGVEGKAIVLGEHQSTLNENMPLRNLLYIGRIYEQKVPSTVRYRKKRVSLLKLYENIKEIMKINHIEKQYKNVLKKIY